MGVNAGIQSVFARAILDFHFLDTIAAKRDLTLPSENDVVPLPADSMKSLRLFSAFIAKVQHNFLWNDFPLTLTCIRRSGIELDIFGAYLPAHQQNRKIRPALTIEEKKDRFVKFFKEYTRLKKEPAYIKARSILAHEEIYRQARKPDRITDGAAILHLQKPPGKDVVPVFNGRVWLTALNIDPAAIGNPLQKEDDMKVYQRMKRYCYWQENEREEPRVFKVSKNMACVIAAIDGKKRTSELKALKGYSVKETAKGQKAIIHALASAGIVSCI